jgi:hypothetical protein
VLIPNTRLYPISFFGVRMARWLNRANSRKHLAGVGFPFVKWHNEVTLSMLKEKKCGIGMGYEIGANSNPNSQNFDEESINCIML